MNLASKDRTLYSEIRFFRRPGFPASQQAGSSFCSIGATAAFSVRKAISTVRSPPPALREKGLVVPVTNAHTRDA